ncbi:MAG: adenylate/guanylate cyclase domain-containing protein, partial [Candidatus Eremiobacteraeota bacterium]|nr:adenylate/guanylate cyclase domain-containing protein [Candidatus Eremiobacteraeota bacterium]
MEIASAKPGEAPLPSGTVTFLFSDIEGSTQRWERNRAAMQEAVRLHDALQSAAIGQHGGRVFKTIGDAFCSAFARPEDAVLAALAVQRELAAEKFSAVGGIRVRMALHTGTADERNRDYFGPAVNRVARLMSISHGGQVLLSDVTRGLVQSDLPAGTTFSDLGSHRLKDLALAEHVWQLNGADLPAQFPPLKSLDTQPNNLPIEKTTFVGRQRDLGLAKELIGRHHLVTLFGPGGVGKTRLALHVGAESLERYPDGVWFADFASISDPELVASIIAKVLGMPQAQGQRLDESLPLWLKGKSLLLILDNCEHVLEPVASIADSILSTAPDVRMLTTSRQALSIAGEEVLKLSSLDVPHETGHHSPEAIMEFGAAALFVDRARSVDKSFALTDDTAPVVAEICRRLDGIPLAIELAAARVKVLSIPNLARRLSERFKILTGGSRTALPRQQTLSALIDWSYDLLSPRERTLFNRVGIFAGGFGLEAASAVCAGDGIDEIDVLDLLASLADKSLVVADTGGDSERYRLLESTRAYALDKLLAGREHEALTRRHAAYFHVVALQADQSYGRGSSFAWLARIAPETDNFRAALEWALTRGNDVALGCALAAALRWLWRDGGLGAEGRWWIGAALDRVKETDDPKVAAWLWTGAALLNSGKQMYDAARRARELYEVLGDVRGLAQAQFWISYALFQMGRLDEAEQTARSALAGAQACADQILIANALNVQAALSFARGDTEA